MLKSCVAAVVLAAVVAAPAAAVSRFNVFVTGELVRTTVANPIAGLPFGTGTTLTASWDVDLARGTRSALAPRGGTGTAATFGGVISNGFLGLANETSILIFDQNASSEGFIFAIDNGTLAQTPGGPLIGDQLSINDGAAYGPAGPAPTYNALPIIGDIPQGLFLSSFLFGRSEVITNGDPLLLSGTQTIDPFSLWQFGLTGPQPAFSLVLRQGFATSLQEAAALPSNNFILRNASVNLTELPPSIVPEPGSWAMLIAGFGLVGAALRRRRVQELPAAS